MKLVKSLLLGSAAGLAAVAGAQAADLPVRKAAPVDYVRVCSTYGTGYFYIPGTDTCLRISGYVQADYLYLEQETDAFDEFGFRARVRLNLDFRQPTEYGLLRAFARLDFRRQSGPFVDAGEAGLVGGGLADQFGRVDQGYIQFGGLTAGRAQSFFDFYTYDDIYTTQLTASDVKTQLLAYTFTFGGGLSATIAIEDGIERRNFGTAFATPAGFVGPATPVGGAAFFSTVNTFTPEGHDLPDVVANVRFDQAWGAIQLSGALHELNPLNTFAPFGAPVGSAPVRGDDELGWAIQLGAMFKLPFIAPGDELWIQATYADGALSYAGIPSSTTIGRFSNVRVPVTDAYVDQFGNTQTSEVFSIAGKFKHYWLPNLRSNFFGGYSSIEAGGAATAVAVGPAGFGNVTVGFPDLKIWEAGANLIWTPVKQLDIGVEAVYRNFEADGRTTSRFGGATFGPTGAIVTPATPRTLGEDDVIEARLRIQRDF
jgi:Porin subfamily